MAKTQEILIEVDAPKNENFFFDPLNRCVRGAFSFRRACAGMAKEAYRWPTDTIPGQRISLAVDAEGGARGAIVEPLHEPEHAAIREKIERKGQKLSPAREEFAVSDPDGWLWWLVRAVESGFAKLLKGQLPPRDSIAKPKALNSESELARENRELRSLVDELRGEMNAFRAMLARKQ